ncbi:MAG: TAXI family TRAP transporter solute-binding subunit [Rubrivivax sp.]|nr:TAXI family TRAP transporter solute-binding subunit [Rubrivivax sp.]
MTKISLLFKRFSLFITVSIVAILILTNGGWAAETTVPKSVAIGTTSIGSATYVISVGMADLISKHAGINAVAEVGGGADAIARLLRDGKVQLAMLSSFAAEHAYKGDEQFAKEGKIPVRALIWGSPSLRQPIVRTASGIKTIADFAGKRILAGRTVAADTIIVYNVLLKVYGVDPASVKALPYSKPKEIMDALKSGTADGVIWPVGIGNPNVFELQETVKLGFPSISKDKWEATLKGLGSAFYIETVPANTYKNQPEDVYVPSLRMGFSTLQSFPEEAAYRIIKTLLGPHYEELKLVHTTAKEYNVQGTVNQFCIPFHPGAIRYYKEIGVWKEEHEKKQRAILALEKK